MSFLFSINRGDGNGFVDLPQELRRFPNPFLGTDALTVVIEPILPAVPVGTIQTCKIDAIVFGFDTHVQVLKLLPIRVLGFDVDPLIHEASNGFITGDFQLDGPAPPGGVFVSFEPDGRGPEVRLLRITSGGRTVEEEVGPFGPFFHNGIWIPAGSTNALVTWVAPPRVASGTRLFAARVFRSEGLDHESVSVDLQPSTGFGPIHIELSSDRVVHDEEIQVTVTLPRPAPEPGLSLRLENSSDPDVDPPLTGIDTLPYRSSLFVPAGETAVTYTFRAFHTGAHFRKRTLRAGLGFSAGQVSNPVDLTWVPADHVYFWNLAEYPEVIFLENPEDIPQVWIQIGIADPAPPGGFTFEIDHNLVDGIDGVWPQQLFIPEGETQGSLEMPVLWVTSEIVGEFQVTPPIGELVPAEPQSYPLTLHPVDLQRNQVHLSLFPSTFNASTPITLEISLDRPAPIGGAEVFFLANDAWVFSGFPTNRIVVIPSGSQSLLLPLRIGCHVLGNGSLTAEYDFTTATIPFIHEDVPFRTSVTLVQVSPTPASCDRPALYRVILGEPAPNGGVKVELGSTSDDVITPPWVYIPEGESEADFPVRVTTDADGGTLYANLICDGDETQVEIESKGTYALSRFAFSQEQALAPTTVTVSLELNQPAPSGGFIVPLELAPEGVTSIPAYVEVPEGETEIEFDIDFNEPTNAAQVVTLTASLCDVWSDSLTLLPRQPIRLINLTANPRTIFAGTPSTGTVTLNIPAPVGGVDVDLEAFFPGATVPPNVRVPGGNTQATFPIETYATCRPENLILLQASLNRDVRQTTLNVGSPACPPIGGVSTAEPGPVPAGNVIPVALQFNSPVPPGGMIVDVKVNNPQVTIPGRVLIPGGSSTWDISVTVPYGCYPDPIQLRFTIGSTSFFWDLHVVNSDCVRLINFDITPRRSANGQLLTGTLTIDQPAPPGGIPVRINTFFDRRVIVPPIVVIPVGQTQTSFDIPTKLSTREDRGEVVAELGPDRIGVFLDIGPATNVPHQHSLHVSPLVSTLGTPVTVSVSLDGLAPAGGLPVYLSSNPPDAFQTLPSQILIPENLSTAQVVLTPNTNTPYLFVEIQATYFHQTVYRTILVNSPEWEQSSTFQSWRMSSLSPEELADPAFENPNHLHPTTGLPLGAHYAFNIPPDDAEVDNTNTQMSLLEDHNGNTLVALTFPWQQLPSDVSHRVQYSFNLVDWIDAIAAQTRWIEAADGSGSRMQVLHPTQPGMPQAYYRVLVEWSSPQGE